MKWLATLLVLLLTGCLQSGGGGRTSEATAYPPLKCVGLVCLADPRSPSAKFVQETFGLRQLTDDEGGEPEFAVEGNWIIIARDYPSNSQSGDLYAYNTESKELVAIDQDPDSHAILPVMVRDTVEFYYMKDGQGGAALWDLGSRTIHRVETGLAGFHKSVAFDGKWIAYTSGFSSNKSMDGYWAYNIHDHRRVFLYHPYPRTQLPDKSYETIVGVEIVNGTAVYVLSRATPENQPPKRYNATIYTVNLETGERREYHNSEIGMNRFSYGGRYIAIEAGGEAWSLDTRTGLFQLHSKEGCGFPSNGGSWIAFGCSQTGKGMDNSYNLLVNLETNQSTKIQGHFHLQRIVTDGEYVVLSAIPNEDQHFSSFNLNLYWARISELKGV